LLGKQLKLLIMSITP